MPALVRYKHFTWLLHALAWSIVLFLPYLISSGTEYKIGVLPGLYFPLSGIVHVIIFYVNALVLYPKLFNRRYWWCYLIAVILLIALSVILKSYIFTRWFPHVALEARSHILFPSLVVFIASIFYSIAVERVRAEKLQQERDALQWQTELKFLQSQINPHFLFNILTNLVSMARKRSPELEPSLLKLSGLMRYMMYASGRQIRLEQEMEYLESYISLQKLRMEPHAVVTFINELPGESGDCLIEPMLLIPFVENAFKHGSTDQPQIYIVVKATAGVLRFEATNTIDAVTDNSKDPHPGIGLHNVQSRLKLLYTNRHELHIDRLKDRFSVHLTISLV